MSPAPSASHSRLRGLQTFARFDSLSGEGLTNVYDGFGRLTSATSNMGGTARTLTSLYDADSNRTGLIHPDGQWFGMVYDGMDRATYLHSNWTLGIAYAFRNAAGDVAASARVNVSLNYAFDGAQRLTSISHETVGTCCVRWLFTRNAAGGIASETRENFGPGQGQADSYAWAGHYATARAYTTNGLNQYSAAGSTALSYDANGNLTASGSSAYVYDIENRLVGAPGSTVLSYDPLGRLFQVSNTSTTTRFLYDGDAMVAEYNAAGTLQRRHAHWPGADVPMVTYTGTDLSQPTQLLADERGSIVTLANSSGALTGINTYDEYGIPGAGNSGRFQYTGQIWLAELGMYYYKARIYSPTLGRFMQTDPIGYADQFNLYAYVGNDPVNGLDPSGTFTCPPACGGTFGGGGATGSWEPNRRTTGSRRSPQSSRPSGIGAITFRPAPRGRIAGPADHSSSRTRAASPTAPRTRAEQLAHNKARGAEGEAATAARLGDNVAGAQVTFRNSDGSSTVADFVTHDRVVVETKTGGAELSSGQQMLHSDIALWREVVPVGQNARDAGLEPGTPTRMSGCVVDRPC